MTKFGWVLSLGFGLVLSSAGVAAEAPGETAKAAFAKIKTLAGEWETKAHGEAGKISYRVTANGSVVIETTFPGSNHEMISMYHLDGDNLLMTHYCAVGNQPRLKLDKKASTADELVFVFDGGTNLDPEKDMHIHGAHFVFLDSNKVNAKWKAFVGGKEAHCETFELTRK